MFAPAATHWPALEAFTPPSTIKSARGFTASSMLRMRRAFSSWAGIICWPPQPGLMVMTITWSTSASDSAMASNGVPGLMQTPQRAPSRRISLRVRLMCGETSMCTFTVSANSMKKGTWRSGSTTIKWMSKGRFVSLRRAATRAWPKVMFGTKRPSITSRWRRSAPPASAARTSSARRPKSAVKIEGASFIVGTLRVWRETGKAESETGEAARESGRRRTETPSYLFQSPAALIPPLHPHRRPPIAARFAFSASAVRSWELGLGTVRAYTLPRRRLNNS